MLAYAYNSYSGRTTVPLHLSAYCGGTGLSSA
jgi:hypothetical protein